MQNFEIFRLCCLHCPISAPPTPRTGYSVIYFSNYRHLVWSLHRANLPASINSSMLEMTCWSVNEGGSTNLKYKTSATQVIFKSYSHNFPIFFLILLSDSTGILQLWTTIKTLLHQSLEGIIFCIDHKTLLAQYKIWWMTRMLAFPALDNKVLPSSLDHVHHNPIDGSWIMTAQACWQQK